MPPPCCAQASMACWIGPVSFALPSPTAPNSRTLKLPSDPSVHSRGYRTRLEVGRHSRLFLPLVNAMNTAHAIPAATLLTSRVVFTAVVLLRG